jgi:hypothetical protein
MIAPTRFASSPVTRPEGIAPWKIPAAKNTREELDVETLHAIHKFAVFPRVFPPDPAPACLARREGTVYRIPVLQYGIRHILVVRSDAARAEKNQVMNAIAFIIYLRKRHESIMAAPIAMIDDFIRVEIDRLELVVAVKTRVALSTNQDVLSDEITDRVPESRRHSSPRSFRSHFYTSLAGSLIILSRTSSRLNTTGCMCRFG